MGVVPANRCVKNIASPIPIPFTIRCTWFRQIGGDPARVNLIEVVEEGKATIIPAGERLSGLTGHERNDLCGLFLAMRMKGKVKMILLGI